MIFLVIRVKSENSLLQQLRDGTSRSSGESSLSPMMSDHPGILMPPFRVIGLI